MARFTRASLNPSIGWLDVLGIGVIAGIGFTVSLLIAELAFEEVAAALASAKAAILTASVIAAVLAAVVLLARGRHYRRIYDEEEADSDADGIPDVYSSEGRPAG
jgi:NhaA family Na+:H+ antiporter